MKITNLNKKLRLIGTLKLTLELESSLKIKVKIILALIIKIIKKIFFSFFKFLTTLILYKNSFKIKNLIYFLK